MESKQHSSPNKATDKAAAPKQSNQLAHTQSTLGGGMLQLKSALVDTSLPLSPSHIMQFQKTMGNRAVGQLMKSRMDAAQPLQKSENSNGMPDSLKTGLENLSGMDMSGVKVHYNSDKPAQLQALAYAQGNDIHIGAGQEQHLPHEGWHVVQQRQGRVAQTGRTASGMALNDSASLEQEADQMGAKAQAFVGNDNSKEATATPVASSSSNVIQQRLPEMSDEFIDTKTEMAREILLHGLANMSTGEREAFVASVNESREIKIDYDKLRKELAIVPAETLKAWSPYILSKTAEDKKFTSTVDKPDLIDPTSEELELIKGNLNKIIIGISGKYNDEGFIKSIFGPTVNVKGVSDVYVDIWKRLYGHLTASTTPVSQSSEKEHNEWVGVGGSAKAGAEKVTFSSKEYQALLTGTPQSMAILVHEYSHVADGSIVDHAYSLDDMAKLTTKQRTENAETYAQAFLEMLGETNPKRFYDEVNVVQTEVSVSDTPSVHLKRRMKAIKSNLTAMWSITDDAFLAVKKVKNGTYGEEIKSGLVDVAAFPHVADVKKDHVRLQALLEDRSKRYSEINKKLINALKAGGMTKDILSDPEQKDETIIPQSTMLAIKDTLNLSEENATNLVKGLLALNALKI